MEKIFKNVVLYADTATDLAVKHVGEFGQSDGYEESLYITEEGHNFIYGIGGEDSLYKEPTIKLLTDEQADEWLNDNNGVIITSP